MFYYMIRAGNICFGQEPHVAAGLCGSLKHSIKSGKYNIVIVLWSGRPTLLQQVIANLSRHGFAGEIRKAKGENGNQ